MWIFKMNFVHRGAATAAARRAARRNRSELTDTASRGWISKLSMYTSLRSHLYAFIKALSVLHCNYKYRRSRFVALPFIALGGFIPAARSIPMRICASPPSPPPLKEGGYFVFVWGV